MKAFSAVPSNPALVAIDIAKSRHEALLETAQGQRRRLVIGNTLPEFKKFADELQPHHPCEIAIEPTGDYHRPLANFLLREGHHVHFVSSIATSRTREALFNSWDKNDPKDAQVILHLLKNGTTQVFSDPLECGNHDLQELLGTYRQVVDRKTRVYHSLQTHYLPLYFPEAQPFISTPRAEWFLEVLHEAPCPSAVLKRSKKAFVKKFTAAGGRITLRQRLVGDYYEAAKESVGIPVVADSWAVQMFQLTVEQYIRLTKQRRKLEELIHAQLESNTDYQLLRTIPGIGPIIALTVLAEGGDLRRFSHYRKFLNYCGLALSTSQSGTHRGVPQLSKRGNARLRCAFWMAAKAAIMQRQNGFRRKYDAYVRSNPLDPDLKRKAYTAVAAKVARVAFGLIKSGKEYRRFFEAAVPGGRIPSQGPLRRSRPRR
jgi:transposase